MRPLLTVAALLIAQAHAQGTAPDLPAGAAGEWRLVAIHTAQGRFGPGAGVRPPTLTLAETQVSGDAGCNRYSGGFGADGRIGPLISTLRACPDARDIESVYLRLLEGTRVNSAENNRLLLSRGGGAVRLEYARVQTGAAARPSEARAPSLSELVGHWRLLTVDGSDAEVFYAEPVTLTAERAGTGLTLRGSDGCNTYTGPAEYEPASGALRAGALASTRRACPVPGNPPQLLRALSEAQLRIAGGQLQLVGAGSTWVFARR